MGLLQREGGRAGAAPERAYVSCGRNDEGPHTRKDLEGDPSTPGRSNRESVVCLRRGKITQEDEWVHGGQALAEWGKGTEEIGEKAKSRSRRAFAMWLKFEFYSKGNGKPL